MTYLVDIDGNLVVVPKRRLLGIVGTNTNDFDTIQVTPRDDLCKPIYIHAPRNVIAASSYTVGNEPGKHASLVYVSPLFSAMDTAIIITTPTRVVRSILLSSADLRREFSTSHDATTQQVLEYHYSIIRRYTGAAGKAELW